MKTRYNKTRKRIEELVKQNGRYVEYMKDGTIITADIFEGTDGHRFETIEDAIEWELGYNRN